MRRTMDDQKSELIDHLKEARRDLVQMVRRLPAGSTDVIFLGTWSIKDLLAHLIGWDETNIRAVQDIMAGHAPDFFDYYDKDWQRYNRMLVEKYRKDALEVLLSDVEDSHRRLLAYLFSLPARDVMHGGAARLNGRTVTIRNLLRSEARDEAAHAEQVRAYFQETKT